MPVPASIHSGYWSIPRAMAAHKPGFRASYFHPPVALWVIYKAAMRLTGRESSGAFLLVRTAIRRGRDAPADNTGQNDDRQEIG
jgi:hypothetical protein